MPRKNHDPTLARAEQIRAGNSWAAYMKGWTIGVKAATPHAEEMNIQAVDSRAYIGDAYRLGYETGLGARTAAMKDAAKRYGHDLSPLRGGR